MIPPEQNGSFVANMEMVLDVYKRPFDPLHPVVCMDESPKQLIAETKVPIPASPGVPAKHDYEYKRCGVCNVFISCEPLAGKRTVKVTECAYYLKEDLRQIWFQNSKAKAERVLTDWIKRAESSGIKMLMKFAKTIAAHRSGILAYYDYRISSGPLEGTNNKIKTMKRMAYGFRDMEFFKLKIMAIHEAKYALVG